MRLRSGSPYHFCRDDPFQKLRVRLSISSKESWISSLYSVSGILAGRVSRLQPSCTAGERLGGGRMKVALPYQVTIRQPGSRTAISVPATVAPHPAGLPPLPGLLQSGHSGIMVLAVGF
jgi:hypothetical protein